MSEYEDYLIRESTEGPSFQEVHEDYLEHDCPKCELHFSDCVCLEEPVETNDSTETGEDEQGTV